MALVFVEGFDHYDKNFMTAKGWNANFSAAMATGRFGGQAANSSNSTARKLLPSTYSTLVLGTALQFATVGAGNFDVCAIAAGATNTCKLHVDASGRLQIQNSSASVIATGTTVLLAGVWYYVEVKVFISGASGTCEVHLNGASGEIASTIGNFGSTNVDTVALNMSSVSGPAIKFDDMYAADTSGSVNTTFLGDVRVQTDEPTGDGAHTAWTPVPGGSHFSNVDDSDPDDDSSYNSDTNVNDIDTYTFPSIDASATVMGVQLALYARKDDSNVRQIAPIIRQSSTDFAGTTQTLASTYQFFTQIYNQDPTSSNWTAAHVNADEYGIKLVA